MRSFSILILILIFTFVPAAQSQDDVPLCLEADLIKVLDNVPLYDALQSTSEGLDSLEDLLAYADEQLRFRETVWATAPRCAESIEFYWQATREADYIAAFWAMRYGIREAASGDPQFMEVLNPFIDPLTETFYPKQYIQMVMDLRDLAYGGERPNKYAREKVTLPACSEAQLASLASLLTEYRQMIADSKAIASMDDLLDLAHALQGWRKNWTHESALDLENQHVTLVDFTREALPELPPCREAADLLWLMYRNLNDVVTGTALFYAGLTYDNNPYYELFNRNADRVDELAILIESSEEDPSAPVEEWPTCSVYQKLDLDGGMPEYSAFLEQLAPINSLEEIIALGEAEISWRKGLWSHAPACVQDIEEFLILSQAASSVVASYAFHSAGVPIESNPFFEALPLNQVALRSFADRSLAKSVLDDLSLFQRLCTASEKNSFSSQLARYHILLERMWGFGGMEGLLPLLDLMIEWRDNLLANAPTCHHPFELSLLMSHIVDDYAAMIGLIYADIIDDANPYLDSFERNNAELEDVAQLAEFQEDSYAALWRFGGQLPACDKDETFSLSTILSEYQALIESARSIRTLDDLLNFGAAQVDWREGSWQSLPDCAEALELGLLVHRTAGQYFALYAFNARQDSLSETISGGHNLGDRLDEIMADAPRTNPDQDAYPGRDGLPQCSDADMDQIMDIIGEFQAMLELATSYTRWGGLQEYIDTRIKLREKVKAELPDCLIGLDLTLTIAQNVAGALIQLVPGVGSTEKANTILQEQLAVRIAELAGAGGTRQEARPYRNNLPECSADELTAIINNRAVNTAKLRQTLVAIGRTETSFSYIDDQFVWFENRLSQLPHCAEAVEIAMIFRQVLSDRIAWKAFEFAGFAEDVNPYPSQPVDLEPLQVRYDELANAIARGEDNQPSASQETSLPRCSNAELATLRTQMQEYQAISRLVIDRESIDELLAYIGPHRDWRADFWSRLPGCNEAFEAGFRTSRAASNLVAYYALDFAGYPIRDSQFGEQLGVDAYFMFNWLVLLDKGDRAAIDDFMEAPFSGES